MWNYLVQKKNLKFHKVFSRKNLALSRLLAPVRCTRPVSLKQCPECPLWVRGSPGGTERSGSQQWASEGVHLRHLACAENCLLLLKNAKAGYKGERKSFLKKSPEERREPRSDSQLTVDIQWHRKGASTEDSRQENFFRNTRYMGI